MFSQREHQYPPTHLPDPPGLRWAAACFGNTFVFVLRQGSRAGLDSRCEGGCAVSQITEPTGET